MLVALGLWAVSASCAVPQRSPWIRPLPRHSHYLTTQLTRVNVPPVVVAKLARIWDAADAVGLEDAACLYGPVIGDTLFVAMVGYALHVARSPRAVSYSCPVTPEYIGGYHTHHSGLRSHSAEDGASFARDTLALLLVIGLGYDEAGRFATWNLLRDYRMGERAWEEGRRP